MKIGVLRPGTVEQKLVAGFEPLSMLWCIPGFTRNDSPHAFKLLSK